MPNRILREGILTSDKVNSLTDWGTEVFYRRLMSVVDDYGRFDARPLVLLAQLYPLLPDRVREANVVRWLQECESAYLVRLYEVSGKVYGELLNFNQRVRSIRSKFPPPPSGLTDICPSHDRTVLTYAGNKMQDVGGADGDGGGGAGPPDQPADDGHGLGESPITGTPHHIALAWWWVHRCQRRRGSGGRADTFGQMEPQFAEMLRQGHRFEALLAEVNSKERDRNEHFWEFKKRMDKRKPAKAGAGDVPSVEESKAMLERDKRRKEESDAKRKS